MLPGFAKLDIEVASAEGGQVAHGVGALVRRQGVAAIELDREHRGAVVPLVADRLRDQVAAQRAVRAATRAQRAFPLP